MASKKPPYEPPPLGMLGMKLGQIGKAMGKKVQDIKQGGPTLKPLKPHKPSKDVPKGTSQQHFPFHEPYHKKDPSRVKITVYPFHDEKTKEKHPELVVLKVPKHSMSQDEFADRLHSLGLEVSVGHKIVTGAMAHIAVVSKGSAVAASKANPGTLIQPKKPPKPKKWTSAGCVVVPSMDDLDHIYVIKPSNNYGPWAFPKGQVDKGETIKQAAIREVYEETGLRVKILSGKGAYIGKGTGTMSITHFFLAVRTGGSPHPTEETEQVRLVTFEEAKRLFHSAHNKRDPRIADLAKRALEKYKK